MKLGKVSRPCFALSCVAPVQAIRGLGSRSCRSTLAFQSLTASKNRRRDFLNRFSSSLDMTTGLIDVDCNLWHKDLKTLQNKELNVPDTWNILKEDAIEASKIVSVLSPSSTIKEAENGLKTLRNNPPPLPVRTTVGVHPYHVNDDEFVGKSLEEHRDYIKELIETHSDFCAAVGECGLDTSDGFPPLEDQLPWFRLQVRIAEPNLRSNYYYPTNKKRYLPRIKKCNDAIPDAAAMIGDLDWEGAETFAVKIAEDTILPMKLYTSSLLGGGTNVKVSFAKDMNQAASDFEKAQKALVKAIAKKDQEKSSKALEELSTSLLTYRTAGKLLGPDGGGDIPSVDEIRRSACRVQGRTFEQKVKDRDARLSAAGK